MVGYERDFTYRLFDVAKSTLTISRDVVFDGSLGSHSEVRGEDSSEVQHQQRRVELEQFSGFDDMIRTTGGSINDCPYVSEDVEQPAGNAIKVLIPVFS